MCNEKSSTELFICLAVDICLNSIPEFSSSFLMYCRSFSSKFPKWLNMILLVVVFSDIYSFLLNTKYT
ncbi:hypothetical protein FZC31_09180 [Elizabethkingia anophelis]|nr:hypothetical protein FZC31_09180 [Elizabethkingia anophelis]